MRVAKLPGESEGLIAILTACVCKSYLTRSLTLPNSGTYIWGLRTTFPFVWLSPVFGVRGHGARA